LLRNVRVEDRDRRKSWQQCEACKRVIASRAAMGDKDEFSPRSGTEPVIELWWKLPVPTSPTIDRTAGFSSPATPAKLNCRS